MSTSGPNSEDVAAALGARRELGPEYEDAIAESLAARLEKQIEARIESRLGSSRPPQAADPAPHGPLPNSPVPNLPGYAPQGQRPWPYYPAPSQGNAVPIVSLLAGIPISAVLGGESHGARVGPPASSVSGAS